VQALEREDRGYHAAILDGIEPGTRYRFVIEPVLDSPAGGDPVALPDPASRWQPEGVHGPSAVVDPRFQWGDADWRGVPQSEWILYEVHIGTFTEAGTFDAAIEQLDRLVELGVTAVEVMPVAQFPGTRNWGYDGVDLFAVQESYGGLQGFRRFVDACHRRGLAVVLDVVYNHLGPEGNVLGRFGPYFSTSYRTPWGPAINFDGGGSDEVRRFFIDNALMWLGELHVDGLRLDAVHGIVDASPRPFLTQLAQAVRRLGERSWPRVLIAESDANDPKLVRPPERGGHGLDGVWADDFHHALHVALTGEAKGYYCDYQDRRLLALALERGFAYAGQYSKHRNRSHGAPADDLPAEAFVVCAQNHDQIGNRAFGERLCTLVEPEALRLAAGLLLCSAHTPLLFMGEEYGERRPFLYFTSHGDPALVEAVRSGRKHEFASFEWSEDPPDPQAVETFERSRIDSRVREMPRHAGLEAWHRRLIALRKEAAFVRARRVVRCTLIDGATLSMVLGAPVEIVVVANLDPRPRDARVQLPPGSWAALLDSEDAAFGGRGRAIELGQTYAGDVRVCMPATWLGVFRREEAR
jgi:maltooligosyltrehalose trehalohydrolase